MLSSSYVIFSNNIHRNRIVGFKNTRINELLRQRGLWNQIQCVDYLSINSFSHFMFHRGKIIILIITLVRHQELKKIETEERIE